MDGFFESQPKILWTGVQESITELLQKVDNGCGWLNNGPCKPCNNPKLIWDLF